MDQVLDTRGFKHVKRCCVKDCKLGQEIQQRIRNYKKSMQGKVDFNGTSLTAHHNFIEITADQLYTMAKHLDCSVRLRASFSKSVISMLSQINTMLTTGDVCPLLRVQELSISDPCWDETSTEAQYGCFANDNISAGTVLCEYIGEIRVDQVSRVEVSTPAQSREENSWTSLHKSEYAFSSGQYFGNKELVIDSSCYGNEAAFINDGFSENNSRYVRIFVNSVACIFCIAMKDIKKDEQILVKYGKKFWIAKQKSLQYVPKVSQLTIAKPPKKIPSNVKVQPRTPNLSFTDRLPSALELISNFYHYIYTRFSFSFDKLQADTQPPPCLPIFLDISTLVFNGRTESGLHCVTPAKRKLELLCDSHFNVDKLKKNDSTTISTDSSSSADAPSGGCVSATSIGGTLGVIDCEVEKQELLHMIRKVVENFRLNPNSSDRCQLGNLLKVIVFLVERLCALPSSTRDLPILTQFKGLINSTRECLETPEPFSLLMMGDTGVGKSFLINLLLLLTMSSPPAYGLVQVLREPDFADLQQNPSDEKDYPTEILRSKLQRLEALVDISAASNCSMEAAVEDLLVQYQGASPSLKCILIPFVAPSNAEALEEDEDLIELVSACESAQSGPRYEYLLPSRCGAGSTTGHLWKIRHGCILHALIRFHSEDDLREQLASFEWSGNKSAGGDERLLSAAQSRLQLFGLDDWPGSEAFKSAVMCSEAKKLEGRYLLIAGKGSNLRDDRIFLRRELLSVVGTGSDSVLGLLVAECKVYVPSELLESGLELVDAPGTNDDDPIKYAVTITALRDADAVMVVVGAEVTTSVLDMLEQSGLLHEVLCGQCKPLAWVHTCGEGLSNLLSNQTFRGRKGRDARVALRESASKTGNKVARRLRVLLDSLPISEQAAMGPRDQVLRAAEALCMRLCVSCLPLLWCSNLMASQPASDCLLDSLGIKLLEAISDVRCGSNSVRKTGDPVLDEIWPLAKEIRRTVVSFGENAQQILSESILGMSGSWTININEWSQRKLSMQFHHDVLLPWREIARIKLFDSDFLYSFALELTEEVRGMQSGETLRKQLAGKRAVVVKNAVCGLVEGNYTGFSLFNAFFRRARGVSDALSVLQVVINECQVECARLISQFLSNVIFSEAIKNGEQQPCATIAPQQKEELMKLILRFMEPNGDGYCLLQKEFEKVFSSFSDFLPTRRKFLQSFDHCCMKSLRKLLLEPAQKHLGALGARSDSKIGESALLDLLCEQVEAVYNNVRLLFCEALQDSLASCIDNLLRRLARQKDKRPVLANTLVQTFVQTFVQTSSVDAKLLRELAGTTLGLEDLASRLAQGDDGPAVAAARLAERMGTRRREEFESLRERLGM